MIVFRHADPRLPFLWESRTQPAARWHDDGEGPAHYFADTPDGAWAELLRHEEIRDAEDVATLRRAMWAVEIDDSESAATPTVSAATATGGLETHAACQAAARTLRTRGATRVDAPSAALAPEAAHGYRVNGGLRDAPARDGRTIVLFGARPSLTGWRTAYEGQPGAELLGKVRHF